MDSNNPLFRQTLTPKDAANQYARFGLSQNPFPTSPTINPLSTDPRDNGDIYCASLREKEEKKFEALLIPNANQSEPRMIAFLMDYATRRGRGIGKTAFINHQRKRIMKDLGNEISGGSTVMVAAHVIPEGSGRTRKYWQFTRLLAEALSHGQCITWAIWRIRASHGNIPQEILQLVDPQNPGDTLGNDRWLSDQGVNILFDLVPAIERFLVKNGVRDDVAKSLALYGHNSEQWERQYLQQISDYRWRREGNQLVLDDLVRLFRAAGIDRALLLVDQVEEIVIEQNSQERRLFLNDLRHSFIDGQYQSATTRFYNILLVLHPLIQEIWGPHWEAAGLDRTCAISGPTTQEYTIYFYPLDREEAAVPLVTTYMDFSRVLNYHGDKLFPFDRDAVVTALQLYGGVPGKMLTLLRLVLEKAVRDGMERINSNFVQAIFSDLPPEPIEQEDKGKLPPTQVDLTGNG